MSFDIFIYSYIHIVTTSISVTSKIPESYPSETPSPCLSHHRYAFPSLKI